ncbi:ser/thr protein kinase-trb, putative [Pediculus humanus corporis]|uniref:Ser/thr protein kinase-trb, putative n=1 Tax=Pediculus humanus subsp. corporis TaxID=121224 RepID=E0VVI4_PEDHC|nr:ser/thr protein kinase-trb, putative [Pediculus humanus corporis]EEB17390.1 ser/thr protein kinase-trb, putative [Pediculus humanus corporis]
MCDLLFFFEWVTTTTTTTTSSKDKLQNYIFFFFFYFYRSATRTHIKLETLEDAVVLDNPEDDMLHDKRGCPAYVSPEILRSHVPYSGKAADMWSLGVILFTMLVGRYPFSDLDHTNLFKKISRGNFNIPDTVSNKAKCLIRNLMRREPRERISSEDVLLHPWVVQDDEETEIAQRTDQVVPNID